VSSKAKKPAVVLLSGGLDSAVTLAEALDLGYEAHALSMDYGQRNRHELNCAARVAKSLGVKQHVVLKVDLASFGGSALTSDIAVPKGEKKAGEGIPVTYVPARNTVLLSLALAWGEALGAFDIFIGANAVDYSGYPDCRSEYIMAYEKLANLATKAAVEGDGVFSINAPLIKLSKARIVRHGFRLGVDFSLTSSCYDPAPDGAACGECDSCRIRLKGFKDAGSSDPIRYLT